LDPAVHTLSPDRPEATVKEFLMPPDDIPIDQANEDSTKSPGTKPLKQKERQSPLGPESEVRGGSAQHDEAPIEQQQRRDRAKP
jgi:hypothetical protein